jgi:methyl-accepting chemotaxis protein
MAEQPTEKGAMYVSLRVKLLVGFTLLFTIVFAVVFYWFNLFAESMALGRIEEDLTDTLLAAAAGVDGDEFMALYQEGVANDEGFSNDPRYQHQLQWLDTVHRIEPRAWPFTYVKGGEDKEVIFVNDVWIDYEPEKAAQFKESYIPGTYVMWNGLDSKTLYMEVYTDNWGRWVSGYAPIKNSAGETVGALGVDFRADYVDQVKQAIQNSMWVAFLVTYVSLFVLVFLVSGALTRPIVNLTQVAELIGEGDYDQDLSSLSKGRFRDEISTLSDVFKIMVDKVYQREQKLRRQVEELRIEIDEVKRAKQVEEIVETDFFRELRTKAQTMRERSKRHRQDDTPDDET